MAKATYNTGHTRKDNAAELCSQYLPELGRKYPKLVTINADLGATTRTNAFEEAFPERSFNVGIAEQNLISFGAGLAHEGYIPIVASFSSFLSMRSCEQIRTDVCYAQLPMILFATFAGASGGIMGATHCGLEDSGIMNTINGTIILEPSDPWMAKKMLAPAVESGKVVYIRMGRESAEPLYKDDYKYEIGKALTPRDGADGAFIVSGGVVEEALKAAETLKKDEGVDIRVVDMHTIKPIDVDAILSAAKTGRIVAAQDHNIIGGLGSVVASVLAEAGANCKFKMLGLAEKYVPLATTGFLYSQNEYDAEGLVKNMKSLL